MKRFLLFVFALTLVFACSEEFPSVEPLETTESQTGDQLTVIRASFEDAATKSRLSVNDGGTSAKVLWTRGDAITVLGVVSEGGYFRREFSTDDDGVSSADFSCNSWNPNPNYTLTHYVAFYPSDLFRGNSSQFGLHIPGVQNAVAGGVEEGLNRAYAYATTLSDGLRFKNIPALLKFRMSGSAVSELTKVKFAANATIAGDIVLENLSAEEPTYKLNSYFPPREEDPGSVIELRGPFQENTDYYMAMIPATTAGFSMIFVNGNEEYIVKESAKSLTLGRSRIVDFGTINLGSSFGDPAVTKYMASTKSRPVDLVVLPDGFTEAERGNFEALAASGIDFLFDTEPYKTYRDYFNVYFIWKASAESGASVSDGNGTIVTPRNTAFGSFWGADSYGDMAADQDAVFGFVSSRCPEIVRGTHTIDEVPILLIINDTRYGGRAHSTSIGRTYCQVPYAVGGGTLSWSYPAYTPNGDDPSSSSGYRRTTSEERNAMGIPLGDWRNILVHEFGGHSFGRLKDEYWNGTNFPSSQSTISTHNWPVPFGLNVTGDYSIIPWQELLDRKSDLVAAEPLYDRIGIYQGGDTYILNRWRSEMISCMIDNRPYFSTWQRALIVKRIMELAGETFSLNSFLSADVMFDPVRDGVSSSTAPLRSAGPVRVMPPLAPPELIEEDTPIVNR